MWVSELWVCVCEMRCGGGGRWARRRRRRADEDLKTRTPHNDVGKKNEENAVFDVCVFQLFFFHSDVDCVLFFIFLLKSTSSVLHGHKCTILVD